MIICEFKPTFLFVEDVLWKYLHRTTPAYTSNPPPKVRWRFPLCNPVFDIKKIIQLTHDNHLKEVNSNPVKNLKKCNKKYPYCMNSFFFQDWSTWWWCREGSTLPRNRKPQRKTWTLRFWPFKGTRKRWIWQGNSNDSIVSTSSHKLLYHHSLIDS